MNYNTLKTDIANVVKTNGNEEITGALLQQCLLAMISNLGQYYQYGGILLPSDQVTTGDVRMAFLAGPGTYSNIGGFIIESGKIGVFTYDTEWHLRTIDLLGGDIKFCGIADPNTTPVYDDRDLCYFASEAGTYVDFDNIQIGVGEIAYLFYDDNAGTWTKETLFDLKDYIAQTPGTSQTKTMSQKAISDAISAIVQFMNAGWYFGGVVTSGSDEPAAPGTNEPKRVFYIAVGPGVFPLEEALVLEDGELGIVFYDWEAAAFVDYQLINLYATQGMLTSAVNQLTAKIAEEAAKKVSLNSVEQSLVAGSAMSLSGKSAIVEFLNRIVAGSARIGRGAAAIKSIHGKTVAWNQLMDSPHLIAIEDVGYTRFPSSDIEIVSGHKYVFSLTNWENIRGVRLRAPYISDDYTQNFIITPGMSGLGYFQYLGDTPGRAIDTYYNCTDLSRLYGSEIDGMTDAQILAKFESEYPGYHSYNPGALISNDAESLETVGFNLWDEECELGTFNLTTGEEEWNDNYTRCKNFIPVIGGSTYYFLTPLVAFYALKYDSNKNYLDWTTVNNSTLALDSNVAYIKIVWLNTSYGTTYNHDICINISDPDKNGTYEPYRKSVLPLNIKTRKGKLNGQGASVVVFADGMNGVGTSFDEANRTKGTKRRARVDLGSLNYEKDVLSGQDCFAVYCNTFPEGLPTYGSLAILSPVYSVNDVLNADKTVAVWRGSSEPAQYKWFFRNDAYATVASFKAAMDGVYLDYELADPQEYVWDEPMANAYAVEYLGTETVIPGNTTDPASAPFVADIAYPIDTERGLVSIGTLENLLSSLVSSGVIPGYSLQFNDNTGDYDVIIG